MYARSSFSMLLLVCYFYINKNYKKIYIKIAIKKGKL